MKERHWWVHHESGCVDFTYDEDEIFKSNDLVEPISVETAQKLINKGYEFDMKRLLD